MKQEVTVPFMLLGILFCVCLITANLLEIKVIQVGHFSLTGGLLIFPISYIINDCIVEVWGFRHARLIIWSAFVVNIFVVLMGLLAVALPSAPYWQGGEHFNFVFAVAPRIVIASMAAFLVGSFLNAYVMHLLKRRNGNRRFSFRAILSTLTGETADSLIFFPIAFGGLVPWRELLAIMALQIFLKTMYEVLILPVTVQVVRLIRKMEQG